MSAQSPAKLRALLFPVGKVLGHLRYVAAVAVILVMGWALYDATERTRATSDWVGHTLEVIQRVAALQAAVARADAAQRGFLLYGEGRFREERDLALATARQDADDVGRQTAYSSQQQQRVRRFRELLEERAAVMLDSEARRLRGEDMSRPGTGGRGQGLSAAMHELLGEMRTDELRALEVRRGEQRRLHDRAIAFFFAALAVVVVVVVPAYLGFLRESRARRRAENLITALTDTVPGALVQFRLHPDGRARYEFISAGVERLRGFSREEAIRDPEVVLGTILDEDRKPFLEKLQQCGSTLSPVDHDYRVLGPGGEIRWMRTIAAPRRSRDGSVVWSAYWSDVTEKKKLARELREAKEAADGANHAKSDFLANMSHELRTPLNSIIGFSEMLKDGVLGPLEGKQRTFVGDIFDAGKHLLSLINDILDLSKIEAGSMQLEQQPADVAALLKGSAAVVRERALANHIRLEVEVDPGVGVMMADERKVKQIAFNLLSNAVKFTPRGGTVTLRVGRCARSQVAFDGSAPSRLLALPAGEDDEFLALSVEDSGVGIAAGHLQELFEPFVQVDSSRARHQGGTGLGLSIVRRLAELHGGTVGVSSRPGAGSCFRAWLPYRTAEVEERSVAATPSRVGPGRTVPLALVIEDDQRMADLIAGQLIAEGFEVMRAATGEEGLVCAARHRPQLITLDIFLPVMDGWEFMQRLNEHADIRDTPVVVITVSDDRDHCLALGARRVLQKPFAREELVAALAGLVDARPDGAPVRVLVADDNVKAVELLAATLGSEDYHVMRAYGGAEAIQVARSALPDVVILDLVMPEVSGFEVAKALRESERTAHIPILVLTARDLTAADRARLKGDVSAILAKASFRPEELLAEVRRAIATAPLAQAAAGDGIHG